MKQTAVEFLIEQLSNYDSKMIELFEKEIKQAKEMEKQKIVDAYRTGYIQGKYDPYFDNDNEDDDDDI